MAPRRELEEDVEDATSPMCCPEVRPAMEQVLQCSTWEEDATPSQIRSHQRNFNGLLYTPWS